MRGRPVGRWVSAALAPALFWGETAWAGPPFVTDDPEPTNVGHWENYAFASATVPSGAANGLAGFDLNYGAVKDVQLSAVIPLTYESVAPVRVDLGQVQLGIKYRFLHQSAAAWAPDLAVFPQLSTPTGDRRLGGGRWGLFVPLWAQKDVGDWSLFGGGGLNIDPGPGHRNYWLSGLAAQRRLGERLSLGVEVFHQTPSMIAARRYTGVNLGVIYALAGPWSLLAAGGPGVQNAREGGRYDVYLALKADF